MRPSQLTPLFADVQSLKGVGPRVAQMLGRLLSHPPTVAKPRLIDLLWHLPHSVIDRSSRPTTGDATPGTIATLQVRVLSHKAPARGSKAPYKVRCEDDFGAIDLIFFRGDKSYLERQLPVGETRYISGRIDRYGEQLQMMHPDHMLDQAEFDALPLLEPVYPMTAGLAPKTLAKTVSQALDRVVELDEWLSADLLQRQSWPAWHDALTRLHRPERLEEISTASPFRQRLAYDELFASQLALAIVRETARRAPGRTIVGDGRIRNRLAELLPFGLTKSQRQAIEEIAADMAEPKRMLRLLQGDVGSGKTVVALMTMAIAVEGGAQAALMAPTEVLARQHFEGLSELAEGARLRIELLTGREKGRARNKVLDLISAGEVDFVVGTHALFQDDVNYHNLAVAVIDEQHRFGVHQRLALQQKGGPKGTDVLVMTATPIPRTLLMTHYGDLDVSRLLEKPAGRKPVTTRAVANDRIEDVIRALARALKSGAQIYWVCPLVESSDTSELAAAEERAAHLRQHFGDAVGLVHGQMAGPHKDATMAAFAAGDLSILVATTVIEVGVNVPNATIMVIEHAERFGLAQLHQLRGRVGRGERQSSCILLYQPPLGETARARLETMRDTEDGFVIAEEDLRLRGGGEVLGTRQSGMPEFRLAQVSNADELLEMARDDARLLLANDPKLESARGRAVRTLLYLFERDEAIRLFRSG